MGHLLATNVEALGKSAPIQATVHLSEAIVRLPGVRAVIRARQAACQVKEVVTKHLAVPFVVFEARETRKLQELEDSKPVHSAFHCLQERSHRHWQAR
jgi:hypothetical protein